jgi:hypothetical protein
VANIKTALAPIDITRIGAVESSNQSQSNHVMAIPSAAPTAPIAESLLFAFGARVNFIAALRDVAEASAHPHPLAEFGATTLARERDARLA